MSALLRPDCTIEDFTKALHSKVNINEVNDRGESAVFIMARDNRVQCLQLLVYAGADIQKPSKDQMTPLYIASYNGHIDCVKILLHSEVSASSKSQ